MRTKIIFIALLFLLFAILAAQNTISTELKFFLWSINTPLIVMIVVIFILGLVIGLISSNMYERKMKKVEIKEKSKNTDMPKEECKIRRRHITIYSVSQHCTTQIWQCTRRYIGILVLITCGGVLREIEDGGNNHFILAGS